MPAAVYCVTPPSKEEELEELTPGTTDRHEARLRKLRHIFELVRINLVSAFASQSKHYKLRQIQKSCHPGDKVMKKEYHLSSAAENFVAKLAPKFSGPYIVTRVISTLIYEIKSSTDIKHCVHIEDLKPLLFSDVSRSSPEEHFRGLKTGEGKEEEEDIDKVVHDQDSHRLSLTRIS